MRLFTMLAAVFFSLLICGCGEMIYATAVTIDRIRSSASQTCSTDECRRSETLQLFDLAANGQSDAMVSVADLIVSDSDELRFKPKLRGKFDIAFDYYILAYKAEGWSFALDKLLDLYWRREGSVVKVGDWRPSQEQRMRLIQVIKDRASLRDCDSRPALTLAKFFKNENDKPQENYWREQDEFLCTNEGKIK